MGSRSNSQANQTQTTANYDRRLANDGGIVATEGSFIDAANRSTTNFSSTTNTLDGGAIKAAFDFATNNDATLGAGLGNVLDFARDNDAMLGTGFGKLLDFASTVTTKTQDNATALNSRFQDNVLQAFDSAKGAAGNGIDQKTLIVLGVSAAAALVFINRKN